MNMDYEPLEKAEQRMEKAVEALTNDFTNIRAGRANPNLLKKVLVNYYGTPTPVTQVGNVSVPEPRMITISLWDASMLKEVEKAIIAANLGLNPSNDGKIIRLVFPELTMERRQELIKEAKRRAEEAKVAIRAVRRDANEKLKKDKKDSLITEDDFDLYEEECQKITDKFVKEVDDILKDKEAEITEI